MRILIVEDDVKTAAFVRKGFIQNGYTVTCVADGAAGLYQALNGEADCVILDIMLPKMNGIDVVKALRKANCTLPVIILSARNATEDKIQGLEAGADDYLAKPFSINELIARVQAQLRRLSSLPESTCLQVEDLKLDLRSRKVFRGEQMIDLQPLEFQLLEYLMRSRGRVVSKTTIMEHVWDYNFDPQTNVVEARICRLRDKLDKGYDRKFIRTVRGFGYVFE